MIFEKMLDLDKSYDGDSAPSEGDKQKADKLKSLVKKLLIQVDTEKRGYVRTEVFKHICQLHTIILGPTAMATLTRSCSVPG